MTHSKPGEFEGRRILRFVALTASGPIILSAGILISAAFTYALVVGIADRVGVRHLGDDDSAGDGT